jgi:hypothetical protein
MEIEECVDCLNSDIVMQEVEVVPSCILEHPGFSSLCLDKWTLRFAATKLRTRKKQEYRQTNTEDRHIVIEFIKFLYFIIPELSVNAHVPSNTCIY